MVQREVNYETNHGQWPFYVIAMIFIGRVENG